MKLQWVVVFVSDLEKAKAFYRDKLGFSVVDEKPESKDVVFKTQSGETFGVHIPSEKNRHKAQIGRSTGMLFWVPNVRTAIAELKAKGVMFTAEEAPAPGRPDIATFVDDDGNEFGLVEQEGL